MRTLINAIDSLPMLFKLLLCIPAVAVSWMIYRICRSLEKGNMIGAIIAAVLIIVGLPWAWAVDLVCLLVMGKVWWID